MSDYVFAYHGRKEFANPEEGKKHLEKWQAWIKGLGDAAINPGTPLGLTSIVSSNGVTDNNEPNQMTGFSVVRADGMEEALNLAKSCPHLEIGTIEVAEIMEL